MKFKSPGPDFEIGSENIYADLGFEDAKEMAAKADLVREIRTMIQRGRLTLAEVARLAEIDERTATAVLRGRFGSLKVEQLAQVLGDLRTDFS